MEPKLFLGLGKIFGLKIVGQTDVTYILLYTSPPPVELPRNISMFFYSRTIFCQIAWQGKNIVVKKPLHFGLLLQGQGTFQKKAIHNREHQSSNDQKPPLA